MITTFDVALPTIPFDYSRCRLTVVIFYIFLNICLKNRMIVVVFSKYLCFDHIKECFYYTIQRQYLVLLSLLTNSSPYSFLHVNGIYPLTILKNKNFLQLISQDVHWRTTMKPLKPKVKTLHNGLCDDSPSLISFVCVRFHYDI